MISLHFTDTPVKDFASAAKGDNKTFKKYFHGMLKRGVYLPPSAFESYFLNDATSYKDLDTTLEAFSPNPPFRIKAPSGAPIKNISNTSIRLGYMMT